MPTIDPKGFLQMEIKLVVCAALIDRDGRVLINLRPKGKVMAGFWEFPGGKTLVDESTENALIREIKEELKINIQEYKFLYDYIFEYKSLNKKIHLYFYLITKFDNDIINTIHEQLKWIEIQELSNYDFLEGDYEIIEKIINNDIKI